MPKKTTRLRTRAQAKGIRKSEQGLDAKAPKSGNLVARLDRLSRLISAEVSASLDRNLARVKPEVFGGYIDRGRSAVYELRQSPDPLLAASKTVFLGIHDTDPECLSRISYLIGQAAALIAADRRRRGVRTQICVQSGLFDEWESQP